MRKPNLFHYIFAKVFWICGFGGAVLFTWRMMGETGFRFENILKLPFWDSLYILSAYPMLAIVGFIMGTFVYGIVVGVHFGQIRKGRRLKVDDEVVVLKGKHIGVRSKVYEVWDIGQVRVCLGREAGKACNDVFFDHEVFLAKKVEEETEL